MCFPTVDIYYVHCYNFLIGSLDCLHALCFATGVTLVFSVQHTVENCFKYYTNYFVELVMITLCAAKLSWLAAAFLENDRSCKPE